MYCRRSAVNDDRSRKTRLAFDDVRRQERWAVDDARSRIAFYQAQSKESLDRVDRNLDLIRENLLAIRKMRKTSATIPRYSPSSFSISSFASRRHRPSRHDYPPLELPLKWRDPPPLQCRTRVPKPPPVPPFASDSKCSFEDSSLDLLDRETDADSTVAQLIGTRLERQYSIPLDSQIPDPTHTADTSIPSDHSSGITGVNSFADNVQDLEMPTAADQTPAHPASNSPTRHVHELDTSRPNPSLVACSRDPTHLPSLSLQLAIGPDTESDAEIDAVEEGLNLRRSVMISGNLGGNITPSYHSKSTFPEIDLLPDDATQDLLGISSSDFSQDLLGISSPDFSHNQTCEPDLLQIGSTVSIDDCLGTSESFMVESSVLKNHISYECIPGSLHLAEQGVLNWKGGKEKEGFKNMSKNTTSLIGMIYLHLAEYVFTVVVEISGLNLIYKVDHRQCPSAARHNVKVGHLNEAKTKLLARQYTGYLFYTESFGPLEDDTVYYYRCGRQEPDFQFKTPPSKFPLTFVVVGDLGQTDWTASTLSHINDCQYDLHLLPGDLSYADYLQHLWDSFGELIQPYASARPWMETEGNHEMESIPFIKSPFQSYNARWKMPYAESGSTSNLYYSFEVAGVHVIMLGSYTDYGEYSDQYAWLKAEFGCPYWFPTKVQKTDVVNAVELEYNERVDDSVSKHQVIRLLFAYDSRLTFRLSGTGPEGVTIRLYIEQYVNNSSRLRGTHRKPLHVLILKPAFKVFDPGICCHLTSILSIEPRLESSSFLRKGRMMRSILSK